MKKKTRTYNIESQKRERKKYEKYITIVCNIESQEVMQTRVNNRRKP